MFKIFKQFLATQLCYAMKLISALKKINKYYKIILNQNYFQHNE